MSIHHTFLVALASLTLLLGSCKDNDPKAGDPLVKDDDAQHPGNDGGKIMDDALDPDAAETAGSVNSYANPDSADVDDYEKITNAEDDNPNFTTGNATVAGDPTTPGAPLADGSAGRLKNTGVNAQDEQDERIVPASASTGAQTNSQRLNSDSPYGSNVASPGNQTIIGNDAANRPRQAAYGGGNVKTYVNTLYGGGTLSTDNPQGDLFKISTYRPPVTNPDEADYSESKSKFVPVPNWQKHVAYVPAVPQFTPLISWNAAPVATTTADEDNRDQPYPTYGDGCANATDVAGCSSAAFNEAISPVLNDPRVARNIANGNVSGFVFEVDAQGRVLPQSLRTEKSGKTCNDADCDRLQALMAAVLSQNTWQPARVGGQAAATRVYVPLSVQRVAAN